MAPLSKCRGGLLLVFVVSLLYTGTASFSLNRKNVENNLNQALKVIERQKRHVLFNEPQRDWPDTNQVFYDWENRAYPDFDDDRRYESAFDIPALTDLYAGQYRGDDQPSLDPSGPYQWRAMFDEDDQDPGLNDIDTGSEPVSDEELRDMFGPPPNEERMEKKSNVGEAILAESMLGKRIPEYDPSREADKRASDNSLSEEEVQELLKGAGMDFDQGMLEEGKMSDDATAVSQNEIEDLFKDVGGVDAPEDIPEDDEGDDSQIMFIPTGGLDEDTDDDGAIDTDEQLPEIPPEAIDQNVNNINSVHGTIKKRSNWNPYPRSMRQSGDAYGFENEITDDDEDSSINEDLENQLAVSRADVEILKNFLALEDEENANLAKALSLATRSQTERTNKYMAEEIEYIKDAIKDEMDLKEIRDVLQIASALKESVQEEGDDEGLDFPTSHDMDFVSKRDFPLDEDDEESLDIPGVSLDEDEVPLETSSSEDDYPLDLTSQDLVNILLVSKLKKILSNAAAENDLEKMYNGQAAGGLQKWYNSPPLPGQQTEDDDEYYINPLTRELLEKLQEQGASKRAAASVPTYNSDGYQDTDVCPSVLDLTDDCQFMQTMGLSLDEEATDLCNWHTVCYTCGAAMGLSPNDCDKEYLGDSASLCGSEAGCHQDAAGLFIMMLKNHDFLGISSVPDECADPCVTDYLLSDTPTSRK